MPKPDDHLLRNRAHCVRFVLLVMLSLLAIGPTSTEALGQSPKELLDRGIAYYNNDDVTDKAVTVLRTILTRYSTSPEAEDAQYYLASYYQRKFYIIKRNKGRNDQLSLTRARTEYANYTRTYFKKGSKKWLSDAFFNLALVHFQLNDSQKGVWELNKMCDYWWMDTEVYLYEVIWSPDAADVIDGSFNSYSLGDFVRTYETQNPKHSFQDLVNMIERWCRATKSQKKK